MTVVNGVFVSDPEDPATRPWSAIEASRQATIECRQGRSGELVQNTVHQFWWKDRSCTHEEKNKICDECESHQLTNQREYDWPMTCLSMYANASRCLAVAWTRLVTWHRPCLCMRGPGVTSLRPTPEDPAASRSRGVPCSWLCHLQASCQVTVNQLSITPVCRRLIVFLLLHVLTCL